MFQKIAIFSCLLLTTSCMILHPLQLPTLLLRLQQNLEPSYSFAYEVNDAKTGDIKTQSESRKGDVVFGQYSLVQPDGVRRVVDYRADDATGFMASVKHETTRIPEIEEAPTALTTLDPEVIKQFLEQPPAAPVTQRSVSRSHVIQSIPNLTEPYLSTIIHN